MRRDKADPRLKNRTEDNAGKESGWITLEQAEMWRASAGRGSRTSPLRAHPLASAEGTAILCIDVSK